MIFVWIITIAFIVLTVYLMSGRGGWLISGFNGLSKEEKAQYDEKKLCRWVGSTMTLPISLMLILVMYQKSEQLILLESAVFTVYIIGIIVLTNIKGIGKKKQS